MLEKLRNTFILNENTSPLIKEIYIKHKNEYLDYLHCILYPENTKPVKVPFEFYLPTKVCTQTINKTITVNNNETYNFNVENDNLPKYIMSMYRVVSAVMLITSKQKGFIELVITNNKISTNISKEWGNKKLPLKLGGRIIYVPNDDKDFEFKYVKIPNEKYQIFNCKFNVIQPSDIQIKIIRHFEYVAEKEYSVYDYDDDDSGLGMFIPNGGSTTNDIPFNIPINTTPNSNLPPGYNTQTIPNQNTTGDSGGGGNNNNGNGGNNGGNNSGSGGNRTTPRTPWTDTLEIGLTTGIIGAMAQELLGRRRNRQIPRPPNPDDFNPIPNPTNPLNDPTPYINRNQDYEIEFGELNLPESNENTTQEQEISPNNNPLTTNNPNTNLRRSGFRTNVAGQVIQQGFENFVNNWTNVGRATVNIGTQIGQTGLNINRAVSRGITAIGETVGNSLVNSLSELRNTISTAVDTFSEIHLDYNTHPESRNVPGIQTLNTINPTPGVQIQNPPLEIQIGNRRNLSPNKNIIEEEEKEPLLKPKDRQNYFKRVNFFDDEYIDDITNVFINIKLVGCR